MNLPETIEYLLSLGHETVAIKLGLRNTQVLLEALDNPHKSFQSVQIAGTNGKGSTAVFLDSICRAAGIPTGLYTSPHLVSITERIVISGAAISEEDFAMHATQVRAAAESLLDSKSLESLPTFFEHVTAIALLAFKEAGVALAILETGLGGRLDATTVAAADTVAITPISLDHQEYLGETLAAIAAEKAAIIRPGVTAIIAPQPLEALEVIRRRCAAVDIEPDLEQLPPTIDEATEDGRLRITFATKNASYSKVLLGLRGRHQVTNATVAIRLAEAMRRQGFEISANAVIEGLANARHAGRLELIPGEPPVLLDGAHNPSGAQALRSFLDEFVKSPITLVVGVMKDKNLQEITETLFPIAEFLVITQPDNPRSAHPDALIELAADHISEDKIIVAKSVQDAIALAKQITPPTATICVTGSLYLVGEVKALLDQEVFVTRA